MEFLDTSTILNKYGESVDVQNILARVAILAVFKMLIVCIISRLSAVPVKYFDDVLMK